MKLKKVFIGLFTLLLAIVLVACSGKQVTITFESNGGSDVAAITAKAGADLTKPADPTHATMVFGGWYSDIDLTQEYVFPEKMPESSLTLYAKWLVKITFDSKGGPAVEPIIGEAGKTYKMPADPVRDGYVFVGWFTDAAMTQKLSYVMPRANTTAYAKWQVFEAGSAINVPLAFSDNDGVFQTAAETDGFKITATAGKGEWSYCATMIPVPTKHNLTVVVELVGTKGTNVTLKVEGGNAVAATETTVEMTGADQKVIWTGVEDNFSTVSGAKFLVFLNGGTAGCGDTPEYVKIKSVKLYRTVDAEATQKAAIFFAVNGGDDIEEIYDAPGANVVAPQDPTRAGYIFGGWFADPECTQAFTFSTMPATGATVYAKWEKDASILEDIDLVLEGGAHDEHVVATYANEVLTISKTADAGEWEWYKVELPEGESAAGYTYLRAHFKGPKGEQILFKVNDQNAGEAWVTCTGKEQIIDFKFELRYDAEKSAVVVFPKPGATGASGEYEIYSLSFGNYPGYVDLIKEGWVTPVDEAGAPKTKTSFEIKDATLTFSKEANSGADYEWDHIKFTGEVDLTRFNGLYVVVKGTAGERLLIKVYDTKEQWVDLTGQDQEIFIEFDMDYNPAKPALVLFANPGVAGTGHDVVFSQIIFVRTEVPEEEPVDVDILENAAITPNAHVVSKALSISKDSTNEWEHVGLNVTDDLTGYNKVVAKVQGTAGEQILFKANDKNPGEHWVTLTGEVQDVEYTLPENFEWTSSNRTMILFANAGVAGTGHEILITKLELQGEGKDPIDLLGGALTHSDAHNASRVLIITKPTTVTNEWDSVWLEVRNNLVDYEGVRYAVKGTAGEKVLFKANDQIEKWVTLDGTLQEGIIDLSTATLESGKKAMILFANGGAAGSGNPIYIYEVTYLVELPEE